MSNRHNPEFTMLELYEAYGDYHSMMELTEALISGACMEINGTYEIAYQGTSLSLEPPWRRMTMVEAVREYVGIDFDLIETDEEAREAARARGLEDVPARMTWGEALSECFEEFAEQHLIQPTFILDYPIEVSPLAKIKQGTNGRLTERFEIFIYGREHGNAYSELNDPFDQARRFDDQKRRREAGDEEANLPDYDFIEALEVGMPPTGGLGIGIDRVVMLLTDQPSIRDVLLFPTMKPLGE
jgi:lysyl-tRNA synthetase class 2